jgi:hypothetical protein
MDKDKIKKMSKQEVMEALERLTSKPTNKNMKSMKTPDYKIFKKPKPKAEDYFSKEFLEELNDYIHDKDAKKILIKMIHNKSDDGTSSSEED